MCFQKFNDVRHFVAATVRCGHGEPRAKTTLTDILAQSKLQFLAALENKFAIWRAIPLYPRCVGKRGEVSSPPFARVCVPLDEGYHRSRNRERLHFSGSSLVIMERTLVPVLHLRIITMARKAQGSNAGEILPSDLEALAHNPFGNLVFAVGLTHAEAVLLFP
jgi:hypothetical protein